MPRFIVTLERTVDQYADYAVDNCTTFDEAVAHVQQLCQTERGRARVDVTAGWRVVGTSAITVVDHSDVGPQTDPGAAATTTQS